MKTTTVRVHRSDENLAREDQLAFKIAEVAADPVAVTDEVADMVINRIIDNAAVATASLTRASAVAARAQALDASARAFGSGSTHVGPPSSARPERAGQSGVGGMGERGGRSRTRLPRHLPRRRLRASRRQHSAHPRRRPTHRRAPAPT